MSARFATLRRAPMRVLASVFAIALAVGAIGVIGVPAVAFDSLREEAAADRLAHIAVSTTPIDSINGLDLAGVVDIEGRVSARAILDTPTGVVSTIDGSGAGDTARVVGIDPLEQRVNVVEPTEGRLPGPGEAVVSPDLGAIGETLVLGGTEIDIVGSGTTSWWSEDDDVVVTDLATARSITGVEGVNRLVLRTEDTSEEALLATVDELRGQLGAHGSVFTELPETLPEGRAPIEADLTEVSSMIGLLGVVAGVVALVLLAGTTSTLVAERSREVAVLRALGARQGSLRRRLRLIAVGMAAVGAAIGIPLGIALSNLVARMVLTEFVGITPGFAIAWPVVLGSLVAALVGAWLVAVRSTRRITGLPLAEALRDREGTPFGRRWSDRVLAAVPTGGLFARMSARASAHSRARAASITLQLGAAVAAVVMVASLGSSIVAFNAAELEPWNWETRAVSADAGYPVDPHALQASGFQGGGGALEAFLIESALVEQREVDVFGLELDTAMVTTKMDAGRWLRDGDSEGIVVATGFADAVGLQLGDTVEVGLPNGAATYEVVGLHPSRGRHLFLPTGVLGAELGAGGHTNGLFSTASPEEFVSPENLVSSGVLAPGTALEVMSAEGAVAEEQAARDLILKIFWTIGGVIVGVSLLAVGSAMAVAVHERRHQMAALSAMGAVRADLRRILVGELVLLAVLGSVVGAVAGWWGAKGIISFFESANAVIIGSQIAVWSLPTAVAGVLVAVALVGAAAARRASKLPVAATLRGAA